MQKRRLWIMTGLVLLLMATGLVVVVAQDSGGSVDNQFAGTVAAPEFPPGIDWINVPAPLNFEALRGKVVLLDFWTYGCINCIHMIPTLEQLEAKYPDELVIIGVHSAKFENEGETVNIRQIVQRYDLHHPVINDSDFIVWRSWGASAWPTFALVDPAGNVLAIQSGEIPFEAFDRIISGMITAFDAEGGINREPLELALEGAENPGTPLLFPGKVLADTAGNRLFISDSNHNRIVISDLTTYEVLDVIGSGQRGMTNGAFTEATFDKPQGMTIYDSTLYIADVNNHAIRAVDLDSQIVTTIAGTGIQGRGFVPFDTVITDPTSVDLRSPWDVEVGDDTLYIAMAGTHQLWSLSLDDNTLTPSVGNGREAALNSSLANSELAQPSGLFYTGGLLYFADSESSTVRVADFNTNEVRLVSGTADNNLFDFGDIEGPPGVSRLQHALGVTGDDNGLIYIADTYNSRIKTFDPATGETRVLLGLGGEGGFRDGGLDLAEFDEPGGLDYADGKLYVADTNNHTIRVIDLETQAVSTVMFPNAEVLALADEVLILGGNSAEGLTIRLDPQSLATGDGEIVLHLTLPEDYKINTLIDSTLTLGSDTGTVMVSQEPEANALTRVVTETEVHIPATFAPGEGSLSADLTLYYCREDNEGLCFIDNSLIEAPVVVGDSGEGSLVINRDIQLPELPDTSGF